MKKHGKKQKKANDIEASIPVSEFAEYCSALDKGRYFIGLDIGNEKDESAEFDTSCIYESKTKEMNKEIIGYKFKSKDTFNKFCQFMITFYNTYWGNGYNTHFFNEKGYDIGLNNDITLGKLKKHNLLDELFTPVYKEESNYKTELTKALDNIDKVRKALEKLDSAISKIKSND